MQIAQMQAAQQKQTQADNMRGGFLNSIDPSAGPAMEFNPAAAMRAGLSAPEIETLSPQARKPLIVGNTVLDPQTFKPLYQEPQKPEKDPEAIRVLKMIHGDNTPAFVAAMADYGRKMTTHQPGTSVIVPPDNLGLKPKDRFEMEGRLFDDFKGVTKLDTLVLDATRKIKTALAQPGAMKDQAAIYSMAKMLDPEGAVREADYAAISNTAGLLDRMKGYLNRLATGEQLSETQRNEMLGMMSAFEGVATRRIGSAKADFSTRAKRYNLDPDSVFSGSVNTDPQKPAAGAPKPTKRWNPATGTFEPVGG
jgi:hypothetical protein